MSHRLRITGRKMTVPTAINPLAIVEDTTEKCGILSINEKVFADTSWCRRYITPTGDILLTEYVKPDGSWVVTFNRGHYFGVATTEQILLDTDKSADNIFDKWVSLVLGK